MSPAKKIKNQFDIKDAKHDYKLSVTQPIVDMK
jgi:hypothetical protein